MLPIDFKEANFTFTKPAGWTDEQCSDLRVWRGAYSDGTPGIISKWQPSKEDIEAINRGEGIYLSITGTGMPPISLFTEYPFTAPAKEVVMKTVGIVADDFKLHKFECELKYIGLTDYTITPFIDSTFTNQSDMPGRPVEGCCKNLSAG